LEELADIRRGFWYFYGLQDIAKCNGRRISGSRRVEWGSNFQNLP